MSGYAENDEVDLIEVISILWSKKWWIALSALVFTSIAAGYAFTAKEQWTSKAEVIAPKLSDFGDYFTVRKEYARILGVEFSEEKLSSSLFSKFNLNAESLNKRREFFEQSDFYKRVTENKGEQDKNIILSNLINKAIAITKPDAKKEPNLIGQRISFSADTPTIAQDILNSFIIFNSHLAYREEMNDFLIDFNEVLKDLKKEKLNFERDLIIQKNIQLSNLNKALNIAKEAGIKEYLKTDEWLNRGILLSDTKATISDSKLSDETYLFMLGETFLKAQINGITNSEVVYPPRYYVVTELLRELDQLLEKMQKVKAQAFSYQASPDYPMVAKDQPKKALILAIGLFSGLILSSLVVLALGFINRK